MEEYEDDQIGDLEGEDDFQDQDKLLGDDILNEAVNEYIESVKLRDRKLYQKFNESEEPKEVIPMLRKTKEEA